MISGPSLFLLRGVLLPYRFVFLGKVVPRRSPQILSRLIAAAVLVASVASSQSTQSVKPRVPAAPAAKKSAAVTIRAISAIPDPQGSAVEITSNGSLVPTITKLDAPPRLVIDLEGAVTAVPQHRIPVERPYIKAIRINQHLETPPLTRVVIDLTEARDYYWEMVENKLVIHLRPIQELAAEPPPAEAPEAPVSLPSFTKPESAAIISTNTGTSGTFLLPVNRLAGGSSVTAGADTAVLNLSHGGQIRVCPGTTVSVTSSANGRDLMLGMSSGALETHYRLAASTDSILTPDFRVLLAGPGEFHYAVSVDSKGNTCVRALPRNTSSVRISELIGDGTYQVKSDEQVVFRAGQLRRIDTGDPMDCGCPAPQPPVMRAASSPPATEATGTSFTTSESALAREPKPAAPTSAGWPSTRQLPGQVEVNSALSDSASLPAPQPNDLHVEVEAPLVFRAVNPPFSKEEAERLPVSTVLRPGPSMLIAPTPEPLPAAKSEIRPTSHKGFFGKIKRFLGNLFR